MDTAVRTGERSGGVDRTVILLGVGDVGLLSGLILLGRLSHDSNPVSEPITTLETIAPFLIGWLAVAALAGLYTRSTAGSIPSAARMTTVAWLGAANVGILLRQSVFGETAAWPFPLVITGFGFLLLVGWRVGYAAFVSRNG